jgi:hypothetical protein
MCAGSVVVMDLGRTGVGRGRGVRSRSPTGPLLHADHPLLLAQSLDQTRVRGQPDNLRLNAKWPTIQPAQMDQYSDGAHKLRDTSTSAGLHSVLEARIPWRLRE